MQARSAVTNGKLPRPSDEVVLTSLQYTTLSDRMEDVEEAYAGTFDWIFQDVKHGQKPWDSFVNWLSHGSGVYWINGKAGSGKSTLMKYIYSNPQTQTILSDWAAPLPLTTTSFFFLNSGTNLQKSRTGLLRSVLYAIFQQHRELIVNLIPDVWATLDKSRIRSYVVQREPETWNLFILKQLFRQVITQNKSPLKVCLFLDGLDEYGKEYGNIIELIKDFSTSPNIKVCLSSRPLKIFQDAFGSAPKLCLEDLTTHDIEVYVKDRLDQNEKFKRLTIGEPTHVHELAQEIGRKADGVFLWVKLAVQSLVAGLGNCDDTSELRRRLGLLPGELHGMYKHTLHQMEPYYQRKASEYFQLVHAVEQVNDFIASAKEDPEMLSIFGLALADNADRDLVDTLDSPDWSDLEITQKCENMIGRFKTHLSGLLKVQRYTSSKPTRAVNESRRRVQYIHRTFQEYLLEPEVWKSQLQLSSDGFNPHLDMVKSQILQLKLLPVSTPFLVQTMPLAFMHAHFADTGVDQPYVNLLEELERTVARKWEEQAAEDGVIEYWATGPILVKAAQYSCGTFVKYKLNPRNSAAVRNQHLMLQHAGRPLIDFAVNPGLPNTIPLSPRTIEALLRAGAKPNVAYKGFTPWQHVIRLQYERQKRIPDDEKEAQRECALETVAVFKVFLKHGAKRDASCETTGGLMSASTVADLAFAKLPPEETVELKRLLDGGGRSSLSGILPWKKNK